MIRLKSVKVLALMAFGVAFSACLQAETLQSIGAGTAVSAADRTASFDSLTATNTVHLDNYAENGLNITTSGDSWVADFTPGYQFDPFHGANGANPNPYAIAWGNEDWVTINTVDHIKIHALEFMYGNGWTTGQIYGPYPWGSDNASLDWQTWNGNQLISSGILGVTELLAVGTIVGFSDAAGFDSLRVRSAIPGSSTPNLQSIALDNLTVQLSQIPLPTSVWLFLTALIAGLGVMKKAGKHT